MNCMLIAISSTEPSRIISEPKSPTTDEPDPYSPLIESQVASPLITVTVGYEIAVTPSFVRVAVSSKSA